VAHLLLSSNRTMTRRRESRVSLYEKKTSAKIGHAVPRFLGEVYNMCIRRKKHYTYVAVIQDIESLLRSTIIHRMPAASAAPDSYYGSRTAMSHINLAVVTNSDAFHHGVNHTAIESRHRLEPTLASTADLSSRTRV
jgi:hypothetical protein